MRERELELFMHVLAKILEQEVLHGGNSNGLCGVR